MVLRQVSRIPYTAPGSRTARRAAAALAASLMLAGCSLSPFGGDKPIVTGSIPPPVEVQRPLPPTLAFSDAAKIGEAVNATLFQASGGASGDWINAATGSSGTVETVDLPAPPGGGCRPFSTTVTSIGGVHEYAGAICGSGGNARVTIDERATRERT